MIMESLIFSMFVLVINLVLWLVFFYKFKTTYSPERVLKSIRVEVDKLFTEIMRETEEDVTLIEARIAGLKDLISQADERILMAEKELAQRQNEKQVLSALETKKPREPKSKNLNQRKLSRYEQNIFENTIQPSLIEENSQTDFSNSVEVSVQQSLFTPPQPVPAPVPDIEIEQFQPPVTEQYAVAENHQTFEPYSSFEPVPADDVITVPATPKEKIVFYFNQGLEVEAIAEKINVPISQVRLVVSMYEATKNLSAK